MRNITQQDIYRHWLGDVIIGNMYNSPVRPDDDTPSFCLYIKDGGICWRDFGMADQFGNQPENLVQYLEGIELTSKGFFDARRLIVKEVSKGIIGQPLVQLRQRPTRDTAPFISTRTEWHDFELDYWKRFGIDENILAIEDIQPLESMSWAGEGGDPHVVSTASNPAFVYWWGRNPASWKMYRPLGKSRDKFRQENINGVVEGWNSMIRAHSLSSRGKFETLFILSSTKDRLVVKSAYADYIRINAINPKGESDYQDIVAKRDELIELADRVVIIYDADDPGHKGAKRLADLTGFEHRNVPIGSMGEYWNDVRQEKKTIKDFADYIDLHRGNHSHDQLVDLINNLIK